MIVAIGSLVAASAVASTVLPGCSSQTAAEQVCEARLEVRGSVETVRRNLRAANLGEAREAVDDVRLAMDNLNESVARLSAEEAQRIRPAMESLRTATGSLGNPDSIAEVRNGLAAVSDEIADSLQEVRKAVGCE